MSGEAQAAEAFDWGDLGAEWWLGAANDIGATEQQAKFAAAKSRGCSNTQAAREALYAGDEDGGGIRQSGYRTYRTRVVGELLALAASESKGGTDGTVTREEANRILSRMARGSDPNIKIRAIEQLNKMSQDKAEEERRRVEASYTPQTILNEIAGMVPPVGAAFAAALARANNLNWEPSTNGRPAGVNGHASHDAATSSLAGTEEKHTVGDDADTPAEPDDEATISARETETDHSRKPWRAT